MEDFDFLKESGADSLSVLIARRDVERVDVSPTLSVLSQLLRDRETVIKFRGRLDIAFAGYDEDPREVHDVEEVRVFLRALDSKFPFWFYFMNLYADTLVVILLGLCRYMRTDDGRFDVDKYDQERFFIEHGAAVTWLFQKYDLNENDYEPLAMQIKAYLEKNRPPSYTD
jgi:Chlororespiratory reduction 6